MLTGRFALVALSFVIAQQTGCPGCPILGKNPHGPSSTANIDVEIENTNVRTAVRVVYRGGVVTVSSGEHQVVQISGVRRNDRLVFSASSASSDLPYSMIAACVFSGVATLETYRVRFFGPLPGLSDTGGFDCDSGFE